MIAATKNNNVLKNVHVPAGKMCVSVERFFNDTKMVFDVVEMLANDRRFFPVQVYCAIVSNKYPQPFKLLTKQWCARQLSGMKYRTMKG